MGAVFGSQIGLSAAQISLFVAMLFAGALLMQYPIGWLSDRMDRRKLIFGAAVLGATSCGLAGSPRDGLPAFIPSDGLWPLMAAAFFAGGVTTPLYALFLAYTNDALDAEDMPAASGGLVFTFGLGAILGPLATGAAMEGLGPFAFWLVLGATFGMISLYALYRMTQRATAPVSETDSYLGVRAHKLDRGGRGRRGLGCGECRAAEAEAEPDRRAMHRRGTSASAASARCHGNAGRGAVTRSRHNWSCNTH